MVLISLFVVFALIALPLIKILTTDDWPKKWRKLSFEARMSWNGIRAGTIDLFSRSSDKVELYRQKHKVAVLTGGNKGIGFAVLQKLLQCEMTVIVGVRRPDECKQIVETAVGELELKGRVVYEKCDVGDMHSVREFAARVRKNYPAIHILINNAGILSSPYVLTGDGFVAQMAVNYLGHFLLTHLLMPCLKKATELGEQSRVVSVSSCTHDIGQIRYDDFNYRNYYRAGMAYADSKLAQVMFSKELQRVFDEHEADIQSHAVHPGVVGTDIFSKSFMSPLSKNSFTRAWFKTAEQASRVIVHAAISPAIKGEGGSYMKNCQAARPAKYAENPAECQKLFAYTCDLLKIKSFGDK